MNADECLDSEMNAFNKRRNNKFKSSLIVKLDTEMIFIEVFFFQKYTDG